MHALTFEKEKKANFANGAFAVIHVTIWLSIVCNKSATLLVFLVQAMGTGAGLSRPWALTFQHSYSDNLISKSFVKQSFVYLRSGKPLFSQIPRSGNGSRVSDSQIWPSIHLILSSTPKQYRQWMRLSNSQTLGFHSAILGSSWQRADRSNSVKDT